MVWTRRKWIGAGVGLGLAAAGGFHLWRRWRDAAFVAEYTPKMLSAFGGEEGAEILRRFDSVRAWRIARQDPEHSVDWSRNAFKELSARQAVPAAPAASIAAILLSPYSAFWPPDPQYASFCTPSPGVAIEFQRGARRRTVYLCLSCAMFLVYFDEEQLFRHGFGNFQQTHAHNAMMAEMKVLFPRDPVIQNLPESRFGL